MHGIITDEVTDYFPMSKCSGHTHLWKEWAVVLLELAAANAQLLEGLWCVLAGTAGVRAQETTPHHEEDLGGGVGSYHDNIALVHVLYMHSDTGWHDQQAI